MTTRSAAPLSLLLVLLGSCTAPDASRSPGARPAIDAYNLDDGVALQGYDPVAYFPEGGGEPARGREELSLRHEGVTYRFASEANRARFAASPERYEPAFGGWCAYAMADGDRVGVDPESFLVQDGRLLLFYDGLFGDTRASWLEEGPEALVERADERWTDLTGESRGAADAD